MIGFPFKSACFERPFFKTVKHHLEVLLQFKYIAILFKLFSSMHLNNYIGMKTIKYNISQLRNSTRRKPLVGIFSLGCIMPEIFSVVHGFTGKTKDCNH